MIINKNSGDDLAFAFQNILKKNIKKTASYHQDNQSNCSKDHIHDSSCGMENDNDDFSNDINDMIAESFAKDHEDDAKDKDCKCKGKGCKKCSDDKVDDAYDHYKSHDADDYGMDHMPKEAETIMRGLGKIAGSLKSKGEIFAADVVEATAISIKNDFVKEAKQKTAVIDELEKMAKRLERKGNKKAAIQVIKTASKIIKS